MAPRSDISAYFLWFFVGVVATNGYAVMKDVFSFWFVGEEVACQDSFPRYHKACVVSLFGFGDQNVSLKIDDSTVYQVNDCPGGNLNERIQWDSTGRIVTFHVDALGNKSYDADLKIEVNH